MQHRSIARNPPTCARARYNRQRTGPLAAADSIRRLTPMHVLFEDDGQLKAGTVLADNDSSLQVEAASGQAPQDQGGERAAALRRAVADAARSPTRSKLARELDPNFLWEVSGDDEFGFDDLAREYYGQRRGRPKPPRWRMPLHARADVLLQARQGPLPQGARRRARRPRSRRSSARSARPSRSPRWVDELRARPAARRARGEAADAALQARQERARMEGARRGVRRAQTNPGRAARRVRRDPVDARLPLQRVSRARRFRTASRSRVRRRCRRCPSCRSPTCARSRSTTRRRPRSTTRSRCASSPNGHFEIGIHIAAPALGIPRGSRARRDRARAAVDGLHAGPQDHDAARRRRRRVHARRRREPRRRCRCTSRSTRDGAPVRHETRVESRADRREPAPRRDRRRVRATSCRRRADPPWTPELRVLWKFAQQLAAARGKADIARIDYSFDVDWDARRRRRAGPRAHRAAAARLAARQARRRADDPRQQHVGQAAGRRARRRASTARSRTAR